MKIPKLLPCPFCGKSVIVCFTDARELATCGRYADCEEDDCDMVAVVCDYTRGGCGATSGYRETEEEAAELWNRRAGDPA